MELPSLIAVWPNMRIILAKAGRILPGQSNVANIHQIISDTTSAS